MNQQDAKLRILLTAKELFAKQGFDGTSVRQICKEAGTNLGMISYYFGGKDQIFEALFETFMPMDRVDKMVDAEKDDPEVELRNIMREVLAFRLRDPEIISILRHETHLITARFLIVQKHILPMYEKIRDILKRGHDQGLFSFHSLDTTLLFVMGSIFAHSSRRNIATVATEDELTYEDLLAELTCYVLRGLGVNTDMK
ncbi:TetR/AcrR family transcriptional regulator [Paenibacillus periandrae]|uniref:TetR/AcrR family transcriptional regulator n=1 Tax=Paenibacillus periandrae TaxID=1761741 RepID=UPI001F08E7C6|nr:TetR/AcrR family transcriptional regulator [Paenibacillus periandrae]